MNVAKQSVSQPSSARAHFRDGHFGLALSTSASAHQERVIYRFTGGADGSTPFTGLIADQSGNFYGATFSGGTAGTAFKLSPPAVIGQLWKETTLHTFGAGGDGAGTISVMTFDSAGSLYGATVWSGTQNYGIVFQLVPPATLSGAWTENVLPTFVGTSDGAYPNRRRGHR
jgi:hypothetical protein